MSRSKLGTRGMTLMEVCVYCTLLSLFSLMMFLNLPSRGNASSESVRAATSKADTVLERLVLELSNASATSVTSSTSPVGVMFLVATDGSTNFTYLDNELAWTGWVGYFQVDNTLVRIYYPYQTAVARAAVTTTPSYAEMVKGGTSKVLTDDVVSFTVSAPESKLWQVDLKLNSDGTNQVAVSTAAGARN